MLQPHASFRLSLVKTICTRHFFQYWLIRPSAIVHDSPSHLAKRYFWGPHRTYRSWHRHRFILERFLVILCVFRLLHQVFHALHHLHLALLSYEYIPIKTIPFRAHWRQIHIFDAQIWLFDWGYIFILLWMAHQAWRLWTYTGSTLDGHRHQFKVTVFDHRSYHNSFVLVQSRRVHKFFNVCLCTFMHPQLSHWLLKIIVHFGLDFLLHQLQLFFLDKLVEWFYLLNIERSHKVVSKSSHLGLSYLKFIC